VSDKSDIRSPSNLYKANLDPLIVDAADYCSEHLAMAEAADRLAERTEEGRPYGDDYLVDVVACCCDAQDFETEIPDRAS
jgi:hypothetical protein